MREILEMINIFIILVVEVISRVYTYVKTYQIITFTYVQFIVYQLNFSRAVKKINEFLLHLLQWVCGGLIIFFGEGWTSKGSWGKSYNITEEVL